MRDLADLLTNTQSAVTLDTAALDIARLEYPELDPAPWIALLDKIAAEVRGLISDSTPGQEFVETLNTYLFGVLGLRGNTREYYDIRNSCLNQVLERKLGIPITLSVIYMEVARRLSRTLHGIGLPSHFVVQYAGPEFDTYIDVFSGGELLSRADCVAMVEERTGAPPPVSAFIPFTPKQIALRMLQNIKGIYTRANRYEDAIRVIDLILSGKEFGAFEYKQRAALQLELRRYRSAIADLQLYLKAAPSAPDRPDVERQMEAIHRYLATVN